jgi:tryptophan synthase alpha chain
MSCLNATFARLKTQGECALILYLTVGFPTLEETPHLIRAICEAGADIVELGVPFSDPLADGQTIQEASEVALRNGVTLKKCLETVAHLRQAGLEAPLVLMGYCNPFLAYGIEQLARDAATAGVDGLIVPDLPPEQADAWVASTQANDLDLIFFLAPTTTQRRLRSVVQQASGFIYCISTTGVTGARSELPTDLPEFLRQVRSVTDLPLAVGFGISTPQHVRQIAGIADGVIVGSALINTVKQHPVEDRIQAVRDFVKPLKESTRRLM